MCSSQVSVNAKKGCKWDRNIPKRTGGACRQIVGLSLFPLICACQHLCMLAGTHLLSFALLHACQHLFALIYTHWDSFTLICTHTCLPALIYTCWDSFALICTCMCSLSCMTWEWYIVYCPMTCTHHFFSNFSLHSSRTTSEYNSQFARFNSQTIITKEQKHLASR